MKLTTKGRYAVMAMVDLARLSLQERAVPLHEICMRQEKAINYMEQLFNKLKKHGLVNSVKGPGGGYVLAKEPEEISILEIMQAVGEDTKITSCSDKRTCIKNGPCVTHNLWNGLGEHINMYLSSTNLKDFCKEAV